MGAKQEEALEQPVDAITSSANVELIFLKDHYMNHCFEKLNAKLKVSLTDRIRKKKKIIKKKKAMFSPRMTQSLPIWVAESIK